MIKNIVLDMGNVCCRWDVNYIASCLSTDQEEKQWLIQHVFQSQQWQELDQGLISIEEAQQQLSHSYPQFHYLIERALCHWFDYFDQFDEMEEYIIELKNKGYYIYLLSNCSLQFYQYYQKKSIFHHFDGYYISAKYQLLKPSKDIYLHFLDHFHLNGEECLFVDDMKINVEGAKRVGMSGIVYDGKIDELKDKIKKLSQ